MEKTATFTFCDSGENHAGMEQLGNMVAEGEGFTKEDLDKIMEIFKEKGFECEIIDLKELLNDEEKKGAQNAYILVVRNVVQKIMLESGKTMADIRDEIFKEELWDKKYYCTRRRKVLNKLARWNNVICDIDRDPDYENKKGSLVSWDRVGCLKLVKEYIESVGGEKAKNFVCEGNYYYNLKKTGIGFHGDAERRKVVAIRLGSSMTLCYNWYHYSQPIGEKKEIDLNEGDMYWMSEEAVGTKWRMRSLKKLRHSAGKKNCKYVKVPIKK